MRVDFYTGPEFLRTTQQTNPFIDPFIAVCKANGIEYRVFVPSKKIKCGYDEAHVKSYRPIVFVHAWAWRISRLLWRVNSWRVGRLAGRLVKFIWKDSFSSDVAVVMAGGAVCFLYWSVNAQRIADLQHGVIYSRHQGYFETNGRFLGAVNKSDVSNREFWVYGQGYADIFLKHPDNAKDLQGRVKVIGDVMRAGEKVGCESWIRGDAVRDVAVIASQMTPDFSSDVLKQLKSIYENAFNSARGYGKVIFRHHPRFCNCIDLNDWADKYPWVVTDDNRPWSDVFAESGCLLTINSTSAFDAAAYGVPTVLLDGAAAGFANMMVEEYGYPYPNLTVEGLFKLSASEKAVVGQRVHEWYERFYTPFSEENCLKLLKGEK